MNCKIAPNLYCNLFRPLHSRGPTFCVVGHDAHQHLARGSHPINHGGGASKIRIWRQNDVCRVQLGRRLLRIEDNRRKTCVSWSRYVHIPYDLSEVHCSRSVNIFSEARYGTVRLRSRQP
jgi:hypothetical protein